MTPTKNQQAFLAIIGYAEGTDREADPYRVCYGYKHVIVSFDDHPSVKAKDGRMGGGKAEWLGEKLPDDMCIGAGRQPGCVSTAAGRYQIIRPTWLTVRAQVMLPDFGPESQDLAALELIRQAGAANDVLTGRVADAITKCKKIWASFPGAGYAGQPERRVTAMQKVFNDAGGTVFA
jgi:muramidase (phage lysozyme)